MAARVNELGMYYMHDFCVLGKNEVASSNLASNSKNKRPLERVVFYFWTMDRFEQLNLTCRWLVRAYQFNTTR